MSTNVAAGMRAALLAAALFGLPTAASDRPDSGEEVERLGSRRGGEDWPAFLGSRGDARSQAPEQADVSYPRRRSGLNLCRSKPSLS